MKCPHGVSGPCGHCLFEDPPAPAIQLDMREVLRRLRYNVRENAKADLELFIRLVTPQHDHTPNHLKAAVAIWQRTANEVVNAVIEMPPGHGKSLTNITALAWHLHRSPTKTHAYVTYGQNLARDKSKTMRALALEAGVALSPDMANLNLWRTEQGGGVIVSSTPDGSITGQRITGVAVVDDYLKDGIAARSEHERDAIWNWFVEALWTRREGPVSTIVCGTRWHEDDLIGRITAGKLKVPFERLRLPAIAEENDPLGRKVGEALWPELYPLERLAEHQSNPYTFAALFQQRPAPHGGGFFKTEWWRHVDIEPKFDAEAVFCDLTMGGEHASSRNAFLVAGRKGIDRYVREIITHQGDMTAIVATIEDLHHRYPRAAFVVEKKAAGEAVLATLRRVIPAMVAYDPGRGSKEDRAMSVLPIVQAGNVALVRAPWTDEFIYELGGFPTGRFDDQVDCLSMMLDYWRAAGPVSSELLKRWLT
jgi:predicted phage terminase large subunit-like protein